MSHDDLAAFYLSLTDLERDYWYRLHELFQLVQPQKPEKGIKTLILRAREMSSSQEISLEGALQQVLDGASERTHNRVALLQQCKLSRLP